MGFHVRRFLRPLNDRPAFFGCAISQIEIDEVLIWHTQLGSQLFKVVDRGCIKPQSDLTLEQLGIGVFA